LFKDLLAALCFEILVHAGNKIQTYT